MKKLSNKLNHRFYLKVLQIKFEFLLYNQFMKSTKKDNNVK